MPDFDPNAFLAQTAPATNAAPSSAPPPPAAPFDPDQFLSNTAPVDSHALVPFLQAQGSNLVGLAKQAGSGIINAVAHPEQTASDIGNSLLGIDAAGAYRAVRNIPIIGQAINTGVIAAQGIPGMLQGGDEGNLAAVNAQDAFENAQNASDVNHAKEHPLTDFIQKSAGMVGLPEGHIAQAGILAADAFSKSLASGNDVMTALQDARNTGILAATALQTGKMVSGAVSKTGEYAAKEAGVSQDSIARYQANPEAVNAAQQYVTDPESLKNLVDSRVAPITGAVDDAQSSLASAKDAVAATQQPPISLATEIPEHLDQQGEKLKALSGQAFDILSDEGQTFPIDDLTDAVSKKMEDLKIGGGPDITGPDGRIWSGQMAGVVPTIGPDATAYKALGQFQEMLGRVGSQLGPDVPAPVVKELIQQLDGVSKESYQTNAGALSPAAAGNLAQVRRIFDQTIKEASPAYADKMAELAPQVQLTSDMSQVFGNEQASLNALKAAANPNTPRGYTVRQMLDQYDQQNGTNFGQQVSDYYDKPQQSLQDAQQGLSSAQEAAGAVNKLGINSTENTIPAIQSGRNIEARKQLENLDPDLLQTVQDTGVAKQFMRSTTNGSRKAKIGAGIGGAGGAFFGGISSGPVGAVVGGHIGGALGGFAGGLADLYGGQAVKTALDAGIKVNKLANTPYVGRIMKAAAEGPKAVAVAHYLMGQTDPNYQKLMQANNQ